MAMDMPFSSRAFRLLLPSNRMIATASEITVPNNSLPSSSSGLVQPNTGPIKRPTMDMMTIAGNFNSLAAHWLSMPRLMKIATIRRVGMVKSIARTSLPWNHLYKNQIRILKSYHKKSKECFIHPLLCFLLHMIFMELRYGFIPRVDPAVQYRDFEVEEYPPEVGAGLHPFPNQVLPGQEDRHIDAPLQIGYDDFFIFHIFLCDHEDDRLVLVVFQEAVE